MISAGTFREDFYYRLRGVIIRTPGLEERREDIAMLAAHFLAASKKRKLKFSHEALSWLAAQKWPGNVRELKATVECAAALADSSTFAISVEDLNFARDGGISTATMIEAADETLPAAMEKLERRMIGAALVATENNHSAAARRLGLSRVGLLKMMTRLGLR